MRNNDQNEEPVVDRISIPTDPHPIHICPTHTKELWNTHKGYKDNYDGTISCIFCGFGTLLPGYMRLINGVITDLRKINNDNKKTKS